MRISENSNVRIPTVSIYIDGPDSLLPYINPLDTGTAQWTSDAYPIEYSPYLLSFIIDSTVGYFDAGSFTYALQSGQAGTVFVFCNLVTQQSIQPGSYNYLMYHVLNGVTGNGTPPTQIARFSYGLYYYDNSGNKHILQNAPKGEMKTLDGGGGIDNTGSQD